MSIRTIYSKILSVTLLLSILSVSAKDKYVVVIDAGHGGKDPGALYSNCYEKDINLSIALKFGKLLQDSCSNIRVVYTRMTDVFVELNERSSLSNRVHADLFISIHSNASRNSQARGMETYVMGMEKSSANLQLAMRENSVITQEEGYGDKYEGYDPSSAESFIVFSLQQNSFQNESLKFASILQKQYLFDFSSKILDKGVKQANFLVLWKTASPSVLTEVGFLSNPEDRSFISSEKGQAAIAHSLFLSVKSFFPKTIEEPKKEEIVVVTPIVKVKPVYRVQLLSVKKSVPITPKYFGKFSSSVICRYDNGFFKYFIGSTNIYEEILTLQDSLRAKFPDCFIVAFLDDKQIKVSDARKINM